MRLLKCLPSFIKPCILNSHKCMVTVFLYLLLTLESNTSAVVFPQIEICEELRRSFHSLLTCLRLWMAKWVQTPDYFLFFFVDWLFVSTSVHWFLYFFCLCLTIVRYKR